MRKRRLGRDGPGGLGDRARGDVLRRHLRRGDRGGGAWRARRGARARHRPSRHLERLRHGALRAVDRQLPRPPGQGAAWPLPHRHQGGHRPRPRHRAAGSTIPARISRPSSTAAWRGWGWRRSTSSTCTAATPSCRSRRWPRRSAGLVRPGKARAVGFSEIAPASLARAAAVHPVAAVQSEYSLATRAPELGLVQACAGLGTALVAFSPVGRGLLTDAPPGAGPDRRLGLPARQPAFPGAEPRGEPAADRPLPARSPPRWAPRPLRSRSPGCSPATLAWSRSPAPTPSPICASWRRARRSS